ncbi:enoyl-CoA hydratase/isomerase [Chloropicon primus]|uniref:3-hydroxyisobutyryl-CoA hydrolase n=1 Tax=Chloropicon primus TaxID=1764295 RepID=A0A5B8MFG8_9CHLO|nr:enoyl-CoA hydratase/isomerase [Chloropicon primus]UPQ98442.1 enoyl-CoA hydratase/isomerase [Chloropicon primus]|mmetsp:Transcript_1509/g.4358  ORF Transcript_1509/g.4358 Transcript_1509/m.4358 type:complete len:450 (+) Transcript_1509:114-1463(+)|eukprot:QDZ19233.1 enoyl-CoA hydratase/isomerase [Chloropicon primus]
MSQAIRACFARNVLLAAREAKGNKSDFLLTCGGLRNLPGAYSSASGRLQCRLSGESDKGDKFPHKHMVGGIADAMKVGDQTVLTRDRGGFRVVTLNRPKALNALNEEMILSLYKHYSAYDASDLVTGVLLKGEGKAFCAGGDVKAVTKRYKEGFEKEVFNFFRTEYQLNHLIATMRTPYVAVMDGVTMGGGAGVSIHGDFRIATEKTLFAMPECALGLFTDVGATHFLTHKTRYELGVYLAMCGARVRGRELVDIGIATHFVPSFKLDELEGRLGDARWGGRDKDLVRRMIEEVADPHDKVDLGDGGKEMSVDPIVAHRSEIIEVFALDTIEEICEELSKRASQGVKWCEDAHKAIMRSSPMSLKVTLEALKRSRNSSLEDALKMEFRILHGFMEGNDFYEGVRAILVEKDNKPTWKPASLEEATAEMVDAYFADWGDELEFHAKPAKL